MDTKKSFNFDAIEILFFLWNKKIPIVIITTLGIITSIIAAYTIPVKYKSTATIYPASLVSSTKTIVKDTKWDLTEFAGEDETEQLLQVLKSNFIKDRLIEKYNLYEHYEIDKNSPYPRTTIYEKLGGNLFSRKNKYQAIEIEVLDKDPEIAAQMAEEVIILLDTLMRKIKYQRSYDAYNSLTREFVILKDSVEMYENLLTNIRIEKGISDFGIELDKYTEAYAKGVAYNRITPSAEKKILAKIDTLSKYAARYETVKDYLINHKGRVSAISNRLFQLRENLHNELSNNYILDAPIVSEKKSYPVRWMIVVLSTIAAFAFSIVIVIGIEYYKKISVIINSRKNNK